MTAYLIVRAQVPEADRASFDRWYETEHLRDAKVAFQAESACRGWSDSDPGLHVAAYGFADLAHARRALESEQLATLIAAFEHVWQGRIPRSRDIVEVKQSL